jgi:hypothetical protein
LAMAAVMWIFPFATPQTVATLGTRKSVIAVRAGAVLVAAIGMWYLLARG